MPLPVALACFAFVFLIICSGLFSASEVGFFSLAEKEFRTLRERADRYSKLIFQLLAKPRYLLSTILICNSLVNVAIVILSYYIFTNLFDFSRHPVIGFLVNVLGVTFFLVLFGEVLPKVYATRHNLQMASLMAVPLLIAGKIFKPVSFVLVSSTRAIENRLKRTGYYEFSPEELEQAIDITSKETSSKQEVKMLKGIVRFGNITVKQIMRPRVDIVAIDDSVSYPELLKMVKEAGYSRIPVYRDNLDNILGILYVKDLLNHLNEPVDFKWHRLLRTPVFTPETKKVDTLLKEIQKKGVHLLIAVNEYGGTSGVITLEDILEEIIGEIRDEYDAVDEEMQVEQIDSKNYIFDGRSLLKDVQTKMGLMNDAFEDVPGNTDTLAGLVLELSGKLPAKNESFRYDKFSFKVVSTGENRVKRIMVTINDDVLSEK